MTVFAQNKCPLDIECTDNCGTVIRTGEQCIFVKEFYNGEWHKAYRCMDCEHDREMEQQREDAIYGLD